jgi:Protein of unknown function (DUF3572)
MKSPSRTSREQAESLAIQALTFIAEEPERLSRFLDMTGIPVERIRDAARQRGFLAGVLEHMLGDENLLLAFASQSGIDPADVASAYGALGKR